MSTLLTHSSTRSWCLWYKKKFTLWSYILVNNHVLSRIITVVTLYVWLRSCPPIFFIHIYIYWYIIVAIKNFVHKIVLPNENKNIRNILHYTTVLSWKISMIFLKNFTNSSKNSNCSFVIFANNYLTSGVKPLYLLQYKLTYMFGKDTTIADIYFI